MCCITLSRTFFHAVTTEYNDFTASVAISDLLNCTQNVFAAIKKQSGTFTFGVVVPSLVVLVGVSVWRLNFVGHCCGSELVTAS